MKQTANLKPTESLAYLLGALLSDGCVSDSTVTTGGLVIFTNTNKDFVHRVVEAFAGIGVSSTTYNSAPTQKGLPVYRVETRCPNLNTFVRTIRSRPNEEYDVITLFPFAFLSAYFDGDGTIGHRSDGKRKLVFAGVNHDMLLLVKRTLEGQDLNPRIYNFMLKGGYRGVPYEYHQVALMRQNDVEAFLNYANPLKGKGGHSR